MTADEFVRGLSTAAPEAEQLLRVGLSPQEAEEFRLSFTPIPRTASSGERNSNPLLDLLSRYDLARMEIGMISFASDIGEEQGMWLVGAVEADPLLVDGRTGEVQVKEGDVTGRLLWQCARDGGRFLDAILPAAAYLGRCAYDEALGEDEGLRLAKAQECAIAAGGSDYLSLYRMLLGCQ